MSSKSNPELASSNGETRTQRMAGEPYIIGANDLILITGATGFIGVRLLKTLVDLGFNNLRCFVRPSSNTAVISDLIQSPNFGTRIDVIQGNLLSREDCALATAGVRVIFHLAAGRGEKSFPDAYMNSVVTTRNLLEAALHHKSLKRFVNISSFSVYSNEKRPWGSPLDESSLVETMPALRGEAYCYAKVRQDEIVKEYGQQFGLPFVIVRPGYVIGPGKAAITSRVGIDTFGVFLHLGGSNTIPLTYVDNCADAIALAGLARGVDGEVFNVVDDELISSRELLRLYKQKVRKFGSLYVPHALSYALCFLWERYAHWSKGQLPLSFNRRRWRTYWKKSTYSNEKLKGRTGWRPKVSMAEGLERYFEACRRENKHA